MPPKKGEKGERKNEKNNINVNLAAFDGCVYNDFLDFYCRTCN